MRTVVATAVVALLAVGSAPATAARRAAPVGQVVVAVIEGGGLNVLHSDFRTKDGKDPVLPPGLPPVVRVTLPTSGTFEQRRDVVAAGPFGDLEPDTLYHVAGTRLLVYSPVNAFGRNIFDDADHPTGTVSSAAGRTFGTDPEALVLFVPSVSDAAWKWLAEQSWVDIVSTSYISIGVGDCGAVSATREIARSGRQTFSAGGNSEQAGFTMPPSGVPDTYRVGGVDRQGRPWLPFAHGVGTAPENDLYGGVPSRLYESGELYDVPAAAPDSLTEGRDFGGTSAASPRTAGRAARLLRAARTVLKTPPGGVRKGALAYLGPGGRKPRSGPLSDGTLTRAELVRVMHHAAVPSLPASPGRYYAEGFGAFLDPASDTAQKILLGQITEPARPDDDAAYERTLEMRRALFGPTRCP